jgi:hypothetical protein
MNKKLLLVDFENVQKIDLSLLDESYSATIFVGAKQNIPKAARMPATAHRFQRVDFQKIVGTGKNALDFHIAYQLGRTFETAPETECFVLSRDKGFDPLLAHINKSGLKCRRVSAIEELIVNVENATAAPTVACSRCHKSSTIEHHGGQWCTNCGCFASQPDPAQLPSNQLGASSAHRPFDSPAVSTPAIAAECGWCSYRGDMDAGIFDDGEWMCCSCIVRYAR